MQKHKRNVFILLLFFICSISFGQEEYNNCNQAFELCPNTTFTLNNIGANATLCSNCEDDFNFCFTGENSIWMTFQTNEQGGDVSVSFTNLVFENNPGQGNSLQAVILEASLPCISSSYTMISNCESNGSMPFLLQANSLPPNTTYYIVVNGEMGANSNAEATFDIQVNGPGVNRDTQFQIGAPSKTICRGNTIVLNAHVEGCDDPSPIDWYINGELVGSTLDTIFVYSNFEDQDSVTAKISCFDQCRDTLESSWIVFTVLDFPVDAGPDTTILNGQSIQLQGYTTENDILWSPPYNISDTSVINPVVNPEATTTYYLTVSNGECSITDEVTIYVEEFIEIANTFSPNGDGINDTWDILGIENFPDCHVQVYTRWGQLVYQTTGYSKEKRWDGTSRTNKDLVEGVYYYVINLRDDRFKKPLKGTVTIIR